MHHFVARLSGIDRADRGTAIWRIPGMSLRISISVDRSITHTLVSNANPRSFNFERVAFAANFPHFKARGKIVLPSTLSARNGSRFRRISPRWKFNRERSRTDFRYQQSDLDLVRTRHGNFDSVKRNRSAADTVLVDSGRRYGGRGVSSEDRSHRNSDLDLVGTLPKRKQDARNSSGRSLQSDSSSSQPCIMNANDDLLMKMVHKPDCELLKHRQQLAKCVDLKLSKLSGEPQDQGYASERSPEDEHPPSLPGQPFPNVTPGKWRRYFFYY